MNQKKKTIVLWGVIIVLAAAVVALSVILVTKSRKNNDPDGQKNAGTEAVIEGSGQDAGKRLRMALIKRRKRVHPILRSRQMTRRPYMQK